MNKNLLKEALLESIDNDIEAAIEAARAAQESASHKDNQPENQYDTLSLEAAYLAHGQSERILQLQNERIRVAKWELKPFGEADAIGVGALVKLLLLEDDSNSRWVWISGTGGRKLKQAFGEVQVVSDQAPLALQLAGKEVGDEIILAGQHWEIDLIY